MLSLVRWVTGAIFSAFTIRKNFADLRGLDINSPIGDSERISLRGSAVARLGGAVFLFGSYPRTGEYSSTSMWDMYWTLYESRCKVYNNNIIIYSYIAIIIQSL